MDENSGLYNYARSSFPGEPAQKCDGLVYYTTGQPGDELLHATQDLKEGQPDGEDWAVGKLVGRD